MSNEKGDFFENYKDDTIYTNIKGNGGYITLVEHELSPKRMLAIEVYRVNETNDYSNLRIRKFEKLKDGYNQVQELSISNFNLQKVDGFLTLIRSLDIPSLGKSKIAFNQDIDKSNLLNLLKYPLDIETMNALSENPGLTEDVIALSHKRTVLKTFENLLLSFNEYKQDYISANNLSVNLGEENIWQHFFEKNTWIFGYGLKYVFLEKSEKKLETITTGADIANSGKRIDALMHTKAEINQYVLIEIKKPMDFLLEKESYRSGCWPVSSAITSAVSQIQKTQFEFTRNNPVKIGQTTEGGKNTGEAIYTIKPKAFLVIGKLSELQDYDDKIICFELFRSTMTSPEIITYDELYARTRCIIETLSKKIEG